MTSLDAFYYSVLLTHIEPTKNAEKNITRLWNIASAIVIQNNFLE